MMQAQTVVRVQSRVLWSVGTVTPGSPQGCSVCVRPADLSLVEVFGSEGAASVPILREQTGVRPAQEC